MKLAKAFAILEERGITKNEQTLRRWLAAGQIKGAKKKSNKTGWDIPKASLDDFIINKQWQQGSRVSTDYQRGYQAGYSAGLRKNNR